MNNLSAALGIEVFQRFRDPLHGAYTGVFDVPARDPDDGVVGDPGGFRGSGPSAGPLALLQRCDDLIEVHSDILGTHASSVKAFLRKADMHHSLMPKAKLPPGSVFHENLALLIGEGSVNAWAKAHKLEQTTVQRIMNGQDPKLSMVAKIADAVGVRPWQLLVGGLDVKKLPSLVTSDERAPDERVADRISAAILAKVGPELVRLTNARDPDQAADHPQSRTRRQREADRRREADAARHRPKTPREEK